MSASAATPNWTPTVQYSGRSVAGIPAVQHHPQGQGIEILQKEDCPAREAGGARVEVPDHCAFLRGVYRYIYLPEGEKARHQLLTEFSLSRKSATSYTFLVGQPVELEEPALP